MFLILTASKDNYITNKIINNTLSGESKATATITIAGGALDVNAKITLISTDLTSRTYLGITEGHGSIGNGHPIAIGDNPDGVGAIIGGDERIGMIAFQVGSNAADAAAMLKLAIDSVNGHNAGEESKKITVTVNSGVVTLTQTAPGLAGNQLITVTGDTSSRLTISLNASNAKAFSGGRSADAIRATDANVGKAGTIDIFKLYGENKIGGKENLVELSRGLIKFEYDKLVSLKSKNLDISSSTFKAYLYLRDVTSGQACPSNITLLALPLSKSFNEGNGRSVATFNDLDVSNFINASYSGGTTVAWSTEGANKTGQATSGNPALTDSLDAMTSIVARSSIGNNPTTINMQSYFDLDEGTEDAVFDVTNAVSSSLKGDMENHGFRISLDTAEEADDKTYFIKRFGSRHARNKKLCPELHVLFDDSLRDNMGDLEFNQENTVYLTNFAKGNPSNIVSGTVTNPRLESGMGGTTSFTSLVGDNCLKLKIKSGLYTKTFNGSQVLKGTPQGARATITIAGGAADLNTKIKLVSTDLISKTYIGITEGHGSIGNGDVLAAGNNPDGGGNIAAGDERIGMIAFQVGADANDAAAMLQQAINDANGHNEGSANKKISIAVSSNVITLTQVEEGLSGNQPIAVTGDTSGRFTISNGSNGKPGFADGDGKEGTYSAVFNISTFGSSSFTSSTTFEEHARASGSMSLDMSWVSNDETITYHKKQVMIKSGSIGFVGHEKSSPKLNMINLREKYTPRDTVKLRVFTSDYYDDIHPPVKTPVSRKSKYIGDIHWRLVDATDGSIAIAYDLTNNSTKLSTDSDGFYFEFDMSSAPEGNICKFEFIRTFQGETQTLVTQRFCRFKVI